MRSMEAVVFDVGGVVVEWDPRRLYQKVFGEDAAGMEQFLGEICTPQWNDDLDRGVPFAEGIATLSARHPEQAALIEAYGSRWPEMLGGVIEETVSLVVAVRQSGVPVYALSNFSAEKFPIACDRFPIREWFDGILISGDVGVTKPDRRIFEILCERFDLTPARTLFVDDSRPNVEGARAAGLQAVQFESPARLRRQLASRHLL